MPDEVYTAEATSTGGGRDGHVRSSDGFLDQDLRPPEGLGGGGGATNPEQLFAAGYPGCFNRAVRAVARQQKVDVPEGSSVTAAVGIFPDAPSYALNAVLTVSLPGLDKAQADRIAEAAHQICPYSKATRGNIDVRLVTKV